MGSLKQLMDRARRSVGYWVEHVVLDFTSSVEALMREQDVTRSELARRIGSSPAYVTKVLRGDANFTVKSMVLIARALNARLRVQVIRDADSGQQYDTSDWKTMEFSPAKVLRPRISINDVAANDEWLNEKAA